MKTDVQHKANAFKGCNEIAIKDEIVVFGSTYMADFPFYELSNRCHLEHAIYNRSIHELTLKEAEELLQSCVLDIEPYRVFLHLGEADVAPEETLPCYRSILNKIRSALPDTQIYIIGLSDRVAQAKPFNDQLHCFCDNRHIFFVPFANSLSNQTAQYIAQFKQLARFFRDNSISLGEAFAVASL